MVRGMTVVARVIHLTDWHLFVEANGFERDPAEYTAATVILRPFFKKVGFGGLDHHAPLTLLALERTLPMLCGQGPQAIVVQTGDVEAFGARIDASGATSFPGFDYLQSMLARLNAKSVHLFGNHDVWPGGVPGLTGQPLPPVYAALRRQPILGVTYQNPWSVVVGNYEVQVFRVDSVKETNRFTSEGKVKTPWAELEQDIRRAPSRGVPLRIVALHHPPHLFTKAGSANIAVEGSLENAAELARFLEQMAGYGYRIPLVLAGHRHALDPSGLKFRPGTQPPLNADTLQLVAPSVTQDSIPPKSAVVDRPAFAVYDLDAYQLSGHNVEVKRTVYRHRDPKDTRFIPDSTETVTKLQL
jgi:3',5'-cyclic AMP phosphodiesterase CpdA